MSQPSTQIKSLLTILAAIVAITPLAIDMYLPAMPIMADDFGRDISTVQLSLSIYLAAYALGMVIFGPLADHYGRRLFIWIGLLGFSISSGVIALTSDIEVFMLFRFLQAFLGSAATVVVPGIIREHFGKDTAKGMSYVSMIMMLAPLLAPAIGSLVLIVSDWSSIFWILAIYGFIVVTLARLFLTHPPGQRTTSFNFRQNYLNQYYLVFTDAVARRYLPCSMLASFAFFCFLTSVSFLYIEVYNVSEQMFGLLFGINVACLMLANFINTRLVHKVGSHNMLKHASLLALVCATTLLLVAYLQAPLIFMVVALGFIMGCLGLIAVNADALVLIKLSKQTGTATAVINTLRFGSGALAGPLLAALYDGSALPFALLMWLAILSISLLRPRRAPE